MGERIEIVIKGGQPWGFRIHGNRENRSFVIIEEVELGGKAEVAGLKAGDHVIKINDVQCLSLADALQLIESAFRTLTVLVWRPRKCQQNVCKEHNISKLKSSVPSKSTCSSSSGYFQPSPLYQNIDLYKIQDRNFKSVLESKPELSFVDIHPDKSNDISRAGMEKSVDGYVKKSFSSADIRHINTTLYESGRMLHKVRSEQQTMFADHLKKSTGEHKYKQFSHIPSPSETLPNSKIDALCSTKLNIGTQQVKQNNYGVCEIYNDRSDFKKHEPPKKFSVIGDSDSMCCMYPKCHFKYRNCKIHSPPERDIPVPCKATFDQSVYNLSDVHYYSKISYSDHNCNTVSYSDTFQKSLSYSVVNERIYENCNRFLESDSLKHPNSLNGFCESLNSVETSNHQFKKVANMCSPDKVSSSHYNHFKSWNLPNNSVSSHEISISCDNDKISSYEGYLNYAMSNSSKNVEFNDAQQNQYFGRNFVSEKKEGDLSSLYQPSTHFNMEEIKSVVKRLVPTEKDEILEEQLFNERTIDDEVQNVLSSSSSRSCSPVLPLPPPPPVTESEIIPSDEPLPPPPPMSPVKDDLCLRSEDRKQVEAIYANLEMLRNQSLLVNSSTQTSSPYLYKKPLEKPFHEKQEKLTQNISFENEIFSNVFAAPSFETEFRSGYVRNFLRSQFQSCVSTKDIQILGKKGIIQRHNLNLPLTSAYFTTSEPKAKFLTRYHQEKTTKNSGELTNKEEELIERLTKKLEVLRLERIALQEDIKQNDELGNSLASKLEKIAKPNEVEKFKLHVEELQKITNLLSSLSGRLARTENALLILPSDVSLEEKRILEAKYHKLKQQYEEASYLKANIDKRNNQVSTFLRKYFTNEEYADCDHFISMKARLLSDYKELDEKIKLGEEQLAALKNSLSCNSFNSNKYF